MDFSRNLLEMFFWTRRNEFWEYHFLSNIVLTALRAGFPAPKGAFVFLSFCYFIWKSFLTNRRRKILQRCCTSWFCFSKENEKEIDFKFFTHLTSKRSPAIYIYNEAIRKSNFEKVSQIFEIFWNIKLGVSRLRTLVVPKKSSDLFSIASQLGFSAAILLQIKKKTKFWHFCYKFNLWDRFLLVEKSGNSKPEKFFKTCALLSAKSIFSYDFLIYYEGM